jgi:hypothetical protein
MASSKNVSHKLYLSWLALVSFIAILGCLISSAITIHDVIIAKSSFKTVQKAFNNENLKSLEDLEHLLNFTALLRDEKKEFAIGCTFMTVDLAKVIKLTPKREEFLVDKCFDVSKSINTDKYEDWSRKGCDHGENAILKEMGSNKVFSFAWNDIRKNCYRSAHQEVISDRQAKRNEYLKIVELSGFYSILKNTDDEYNVFYSDLWGSSYFTEWKSLVSSLFWLIGGALIIGVSMAVRKWILWLVKDESKSE